MTMSMYIYFIATKVSAFLLFIFDNMFLILPMKQLFVSIVYLAFRVKLPFFFVVFSCSISPDSVELLFFKSSVSGSYSHSSVYKYVSKTQAVLHRTQLPILLISDLVHSASSIPTTSCGSTNKRVVYHNVGMETCSQRLRWRLEYFFNSITGIESNV